jgi:hypothetical protein
MSNPDRDLMWVESRFPDYKVCRPVRDGLNVDNVLLFYPHYMPLAH